MVVGAATSSFAQGTVNILWYTGGIASDTSSFATYDSAINNLVTQEENPAFNTSGSVNTWNVTFWDGGAMPSGSYNVLINASPEGFWDTYPTYTDLSSAISSVGASSFFGNRVMLTGQDADWHYQNNPGPANFNGPAGFLIDAINWAGSGTGMGGVMLDPNSSGLGGLFTGIGSNAGQNDTVDIPSAFASDPVNLGLTSAGLSDWETSAHETYDGSDSTLWTAINVDGDGNPITIVSAAEVTGGTGGTVPDAGSTALLGGIAFSLIGVCRRWMSRTH